MELETATYILKNLKKNTKRTYTENYISKIRTELRYLRTNLTGDALKTFDNICVQINNLLKVKRNEIDTKMASFDIATATKIIPEFEGDQKKLGNFIGLVEFYHNTLAATQHSIFISFILATKLADRVKNRIVAESTPTTLTEFKTTLTKCFKTKRNAASIHNELSRTYQGNQDINTYATRIESLLAQLNELQISEQGSDNRAIIVRLNEQIGLSTFKNGLSEPYKSTVLAARPENFKTAVEVASELKHSSQNGILHYNYQQPYRQNYNHRYQSQNRNSNYRQNSQNPNNAFRNNYNQNRFTQGRQTSSNSYNNGRPNNVQFHRGSNNNNLSRNQYRGNIRNQNRGNNRMYVLDEQGNYDNLGIHEPETQKGMRGN